MDTKDYLAPVFVHVGWRFKMHGNWLYIDGTSIAPKDVLGDHHTFEKVYVLA